MCDYLLWDEMVDFFKDFFGEWVCINIDVSVDIFYFCVVWVFCIDGLFVYVVKGGENVFVFLVLVVILCEKFLCEFFVSFFFLFGDGFCEFCVVLI